MKRWNTGTNATCILCLEPNEREATSSSNVFTLRPFGSDLWLGFWAQTIQLFGTIFCKTQQEIKLLCFLFDMLFKLLFIQFGEREMEEGMVNHPQVQCSWENSLKNKFETNLYTKMGQGYKV